MRSRTPRRRPGRPPAEESKDRLDVIIRVARRRFASRGFDATSLSAVAADAEISLTALYHYVESKTVLYELVFRATMESTWDAILKEFKAAEPADTFVDRMTKLVAAIGARPDRVEPSRFLAAAPVEMLRHPELAHLLRERDEIRDRVFETVFGPVVTAARLPGLADSDDALDAVRLLFTGWSMESFFQPDLQPKLTRALLGLAATLDASTEPKGRRPRQPTAKRAPRSTG